jgi:hypothetical protein
MIYISSVIFLCIDYLKYSINIREPISTIHLDNMDETILGINIKCSYKTWRQSFRDTIFYRFETSHSSPHGVFKLQNNDVDSMSQVHISLLDTLPVLLCGRYRFLANQIGLSSVYIDARKPDKIRIRQVMVLCIVDCCLQM